MGNDFTPGTWFVLALAALSLGINKSGLPGLSLLHVAVFAWLFPGQTSTGVVLPLLVAGDIGAVLLYRRRAEWGRIRWTLPVALLGVVAGWLVMQRWPTGNFNRVIGATILVMVAVQLGRHWRPDWFVALPHSPVFGHACGFVAGLTTMIANAAGPVMGIYFLVLGMVKEQLIGTMAWFFLILNLCKLPFSYHLGLIQLDSLALNAKLLPMVIGGLWLGRWLMGKIPQKAFDTLVLALAALAAGKLLML